jgi:opacity protein-like surface antigen
MMFRSLKLAAVAVVLATGTASAQNALEVVPRSGVSFNNTVTVRATVDSTDTETHTIVFTTSSGRLLNMATADGVALAGIQDGAAVDVTYNEVVTLLNLRQKGPGSKEARKEGSSPDQSDADIGRLTLTVVAVDLAANKVSLIDGRGGEVKTYAATSIAKQDMLKKIKVGDVVIGLTTPLLVTAIAPAK